MVNNLLRDFFRPKNKFDGIMIIAILLGCSVFIGFECYAFIGIANNPYGLDEWHDTLPLPGDYYMSLVSTDVYTVPADLGEHGAVFLLSLNHLSGMSVEIEFKGRDCIIERVVFVSGKMKLNAYERIEYVPNDTKMLDLMDNKVSLNLRFMTNLDYDVIVIRVMKMTTGQVDVLHRVVLI